MSQRTHVCVCVCVLCVCVCWCVYVCVNSSKREKEAGNTPFVGLPEREKKRKKGKIERKKTRLSSVSQKLAAQISTLPNAISQQQRVNEEPPV